MHILLIISGSVAAYKSLDLIRAFKERGHTVATVLTQGGAEFVTPLSVAALSGSPVYTDLFSLKDETEMGHIRLSREADLILVAPASANLLAKMAAGLSDDLASTVLLATDKPVLVAPAMNHRMWDNPATQRNVATLAKDGITFIGPVSGSLACGEEGEGRMASQADILSAIENITSKKPLSGTTALVTSGPTWEPIDPVRYLGNRSSGKQGHAIAEALAEQGARVTLISGPTGRPIPHGVNFISVTTAAEMNTACENALPVDIAICAAAVADWTVEPSAHKLKKRNNASPLALNLRETTDILSSLSHHKQRPKLVIGFAAETENLAANAAAKRTAKGCDWLLANAVTDGRIFGEDDTELLFCTASSQTPWPRMSKRAAAKKLTQHIASFLENPHDQASADRNRSPVPRRRSPAA